MEIERDFEERRSLVSEEGEKRRSPVPEGIEFAKSEERQPLALQERQPDLSSVELPHTESAESKLLKPLRKEIEKYIQAMSSDLQREMSKLAEEMAALRKELAEAVARLEPQPDEYARQVLEEGRRNLEAYEREEPELLERYSGQFAVFCDGELVAVGPDRREVIQKAMQARPKARPYVRQVGVAIPSRPPGRP